MRYVLAICAGAVGTAIVISGIYLIRAWLSDRKRRKAISTISIRLTADTTAFQTAMSQAQQSFTAGQIMSGFIADADPEPEPLVETWSNEKVEAWRIINVHVEKGDPDGLWLGFPHPDGPTADVVTPVRHPVGVELHAECDYRTPYGQPVFGSAPPCVDVPGERCQSRVGWGCGFYAFKTRGAAATQAIASAHSPWPGGPSAVARVLLSGKVIEHEQGYRAKILEVVEVEAPTPVVDPFGQEFSLTAAALARMVPPNPYLLPPIPPTNPFINLGGNS